jgi:curved DNA-binding protein CbpA
MSRESIDLYKVLGVTKLATQKEIKSAFYKLSLKHHPDKGGNEELFELITNSYNILNNPVTRKNYDGLSQKTHKSHSSFESLKSQSNTHNEFQSSKPKTAKDDEAFNQVWDDLNKKHGYFEENEDIIKIPTAKAKQSYAEIQKTRENEDNNQPERLFLADERFDNLKFQAAYKKANGDPLTIAKKKDVPDAWLNAGTGNYCSIDGLDSLYDDYKEDVNNNLNYGSVNMPTSKKISRRELNGIDVDNNVINHNVISDDYKSDMKTRLKNREAMNSELDAKKMEDYNKNDTAGYGIFDKLGFDLNDMGVNDLDNEDMNDAYQKLLMERQ